MREARSGGPGISARYRFSSENTNLSRRIVCSSASIVRLGSSGHDANRANPPSSKCELNSLSGAASSSAECFCAISRATEALKHSAPLKKSSHGQAGSQCWEWRSRYAFASEKNVRSPQRLRTGTRHARSERLYEHRFTRVRPQPVVEQDDHTEGNRATAERGCCVQPISSGENTTP
jgi:hypothetical protein